MFARLNRKGQNTLEYGVLIAVVVAGLVAMQIYMKKSVQGKLRAGADQIGEQFSPDKAEMYSNSTTDSYSQESMLPGGKSNSFSNSSTTYDSNESGGTLADEKMFEEK